jgi:hypothetical protein
MASDAVRLAFANGNPVAHPAEIAILIVFMFVMVWFGAGVQSSGTACPHAGNTGSTLKLIIIPGRTGAGICYLTELGVKE